MAQTIISFRKFAGWKTDDSKLAVLTDAHLQGVLPDSVIQLHLDSSISIIKSMLGFKESEDLPVHSRVDQGVYTLCLFFIKNRSFEQYSSGFKIGDLIEQHTNNKFMERIEPHVYKRVLNLISPWRRVSEFMEVTA